MKRMICALFVSGCITGCMSTTEELVITSMKEVVVPIIKEGISEGTEGLQMMGGVQGINPRIKGKASGKWVTGVEIEFEYGIEGIAGQVQGSTQTNPSDGVDVAVPK